MVRKSTQSMLHILFGGFSYPVIKDYLEDAIPIVMITSMKGITST